VAGQAISSEAKGANVFESANLRYDDFTGLVSLKSNDGGEDIAVAYVEDINECPDQYHDQWLRIRQEVRDAMAHAEGGGR
jgi:hypothetical protein